VYFLVVSVHEVSCGFMSICLLIVLFFLIMARVVFSS
jgi:hypothetical protein